MTSWEVWLRGAKSGQYCVIGGGLLQLESNNNSIIYKIGVYNAIRLMNIYFLKDSRNIINSLEIKIKSEDN
jgi:hypothetical protein